MSDKVRATKYLLDERLKYVHIRNEITPPYPQDAARGLRSSVSCKGGVTIGWRFDKEGNRLLIAAARCCDRDNFNRKVGRAIVKGRIARGKFEVIEFGKKVVPDDKLISNVMDGWIKAKEEEWQAMAEKVGHTIQ